MWQATDYHCVFGVKTHLTMTTTKKINKNTRVALTHLCRCVYFIFACRSCHKYDPNAPVTEQMKNDRKNRSPTTPIRGSRVLLIKVLLVTCIFNNAHTRTHSHTMHVKWCAHAACQRTTKWKRAPFSKKRICHSPIASVTTCITPACVSAVHVDPVAMTLHH